MTRSLVCICFGCWHCSCHWFRHENLVQNYQHLVPEWIFRELFELKFGIRKCLRHTHTHSWAGKRRWINAHCLMYILVGKNDDVGNDDRQQKFRSKTNERLLPACQPTSRLSHQPRSPARTLICSHFQTHTHTQGKSAQRAIWRREEWHRHTKLPHEYENNIYVWNACRQSIEMLRNGVRRGDTHTHAHTHSHTKMNLFMPLNFLSVISLSP